MDLTPLQGKGIALTHFERFAQKRFLNKA